MQTSSDIPRHVLLTGGTGALGTTVTRRLLVDGHRVSATWLAKEEADSLRADVADVSDSLDLIQTDVTDADSVDESIQEITERHGAPDALIHLVGGWRGGEHVHEQSVETWDRMLDLNLRSAFYLARATLPMMHKQDWGRLVFISSRTARSGRAGQSAYAVAKAGLSVLAETIAEETKGTGVTANVVAPSTIDTPANRRSMPDSDFDAWVSPESVAAAVAFLIGEAAGDLRGAWLPVYGSA
jgi:NAD(P)-dependent dehydrogenase (short-subunit alcohol dehydrogenase family)